MRLLLTILVLFTLTASAQTNRVQTGQLLRIGDRVSNIPISGGGGGGGGSSTDFTNGILFRYTFDTNSFGGNYVSNYLNGSYTNWLQLTNYAGLVVPTNGYSSARGAAHFPNVTGQALVNSTTPIPDRNNFTLTVWYNATSAGGGSLGRIYAAGGNTHFWCPDAAVTGLRVALDGGTILSGPATLSGSTWYHAALVVSNAVSRIYTNGVLYAGPTSTPSSAASDFVIGNRISDMARYFDGRMQDFRGYSTNLSTAQINWIYTNGPTIGL